MIIVFLISLVGVLLLPRGRRLASMGLCSLALNRVRIGTRCPSMADGGSRGVLLRKCGWALVRGCSVSPVNPFVWSVSYYELMY